MSNFLEAVNTEISACEKIVKSTTKRMNSLPKGKLRISTSGKRVNYYCCTGDNQGTYIKKKDLKLATDLSCREKNKDAFDRANGALKILVPVQKYFENHDWRNTGCDMHPEKIKLSQHDTITILEKARAWENSDYEKFETVSSPYITKKNEAVRSKSELIIANILYDRGIPYHYEQVLHLKNGQYIVPDFTIYDIKNDKIVFLEHFGMLSDSNYSFSTINKINKYVSNGYTFNIDLFCTFETQAFKMPTSFIEEFLVKKFAA